MILAPSDFFALSVLAFSGDGANLAAANHRLVKRVTQFAGTSAERETGFTDR